jgi:hypothetical protein
MFGNRVLKRIFGCRREEVTGGWGKQNSEVLHNWHFSRWAGHVTRKRMMINGYKIFFGNSEGKRTLERHSRR